MSATELVLLVNRAQRLEKASAKRELLAAWRALGEDRHAERCVLAHYLADTEDDAQAELAWDLLALEAFERCDESALSTYVLGATRASFLPSLELNVAQAYEKLGQWEEARAHAARAEEAARFLADSPLGTLTRGATSRLRASLDAPSRKKPTSSS